MITQTNKFLIIGIIILMSLLITSCSTATTSDLNINSGESAEAVVETTDQEQIPEESEVQSGNSGENSTIEDKLPEDLPIMPGYRKLAVTSDGSNISYEVDGNIDDVVTYYQGELSNLGWEMTRSPDNAYGAFGSIIRINEKGDRVTFSLQYNSVGEFVVVRIFLLRAP
jgi:hypothetical protein